MWNFEDLKIQKVTSLKYRVSDWTNTWKFKNLNHRERILPKQTDLTLYRISTTSSLKQNQVKIVKSKPRGVFEYLIQEKGSLVFSKI